MHLDRGFQTIWTSTFSLAQDTFATLQEEGICTRKLKSKEDNSDTLKMNLPPLLAAGKINTPLPIPPPPITAPVDATTG